MEKFLRNVVLDYAEGDGVKLTDEQLHLVIDKLIETDEIWDTLTSYIAYIISDVKYETEVLNLHPSLTDTTNIVEGGDK